MHDLYTVLIILSFFGLSWAFALLCQKLGAPENVD